MEVPAEDIILILREGDRDPGVPLYDGRGSQEGDLNLIPFYGISLPQGHQIRRPLFVREDLDREMIENLLRALWDLRGFYFFTCKGR
jgi:hypothetical protein